MPTRTPTGSDKTKFSDLRRVLPSRAGLLSGAQNMVNINIGAVRAGRHPSVGPSLGIIFAVASQVEAVDLGCAAPAVAFVRAGGRLCRVGVGCRW